MLNALIPLLREGIFQNKITTAIAAGVAVYVGWKWNYLDKEAIFALLISALTLGAARDPQAGGKNDELA